MPLIIGLPILILGWFFYQMGRKKRWEEQQKQLSEKRPDVEIIDAKKTDKKKSTRR